ncbi:NUDIX domain-containing protein [Kitasatospora sp. NPDC094016]|uniref:NUDIX hydrolase n=1 Tax=Kitasatospora sp. NPDC094016 TaxID=3154986 RepID=UPI0033244D14
MPEPIEEAAWIRLEGGRVLAARTHGRTLFYLPGGKPEPGESNEQALAREIAEELGVTLDPATIAPALTVHAPADGKPAGATVRITCHTADHAGTPAPGSEIAEIAWLTPGDSHRVSPATALLLERLAAADLLRR